MTGFSDYDKYDAVGLAALVRNREVSAADLLEEAIARAERIDPAINALTLKLYDRARDAVAAGLPEGPFTGVPFLLKDLGMHLKGTRTSAGTRLFDNHVADHNSTLVERYLDAGLVIFGKTNTPEFGLTASTEPVRFGATRNPWNLAHIAGGSSGGAAAAVAAGILPAAHASDGGGSIRIPAACCGLYGLKPTRARTPMGPDQGEGWAGLSINHVVSRSVRDSAALLDATEGPAVGDPYWAPPRTRPFVDEIGADPGKLRIAVHLEAHSGVGVHPDCIDAVRRTAKLLEEMGHEVEEARPDIDNQAVGRAFRVITSASTHATLRARARELGRDVTKDDVETVTWRTAENGRKYGAADYAEAVQSVHAESRKVGEFFIGYDALIAPTLAKPPLPLGLLAMTTDDIKSYAINVAEFAAFTSLYNMTGQPSASLPVHWNEEGLPIGVMLTTRFGDEATLFRLSSALEEAVCWADRRPDFAALEAAAAE